MHSDSGVWDEIARSLKVSMPNLLQTIEGAMATVGAHVARLIDNLPFDAFDLICSFGSLTATIALTRVNKRLHRDMFRLRIGGCHMASSERIQKKLTKFISQRVVHIERLSFKENPCDEFVDFMGEGMVEIGAIVQALGWTENLNEIVKAGVVKHVSVTHQCTGKHWRGIGPMVSTAEVLCVDSPTIPNAFVHYLQSCVLPGEKRVTMHFITNEEFRPDTHLRGVTGPPEICISLRADGGGPISLILKTKPVFHEFALVDGIYVSVP